MLGRRLLLWLLWLALGAAVPGTASAQFCLTDSDCPCGQSCAALVCTGACFFNSRCLEGEFCAGPAGCLECGGHFQPTCPTGARCNGTQAAACDLWKNQGTLAGFSGCQNCGGTGQTPCYVPGFVDFEGVLASHTDPPNVACQEYRTPDLGSLTCVTCGAPGQPLCTRLVDPPLDDLCQPAYSPLTLGAVAEDPTCYACGADGQFTCTHSATPRCDAAPSEFSLDPVRPQVVAGIQAALPEFIEDKIPPGALDQLDACWLPELPSFARDAPVSWPAAESPPGPRTEVFVHGRGGGGQGAPPYSTEALGARNVLQYFVDYNSYGQSALPFRMWAWNEKGQPYVAFEGDEIIDWPASYDFTLSDVGSFVHQALSILPVKGEVTLIGHSMGGYVVKDVIHRFHDPLRFRGRPIAETVFLGHPHFGVVLDPAEYTPFLCTGLAEAYTSGGSPQLFAQDCQSGRWMMGWENSGARIDDQEYPHVKWAAGTGDCEVNCGPPEVHQPFSETAGFEPAGFPGWAALDGDGLIDTDSGLGFDPWGRFPVSPLAFDRTATRDCDHSPYCGLDALLSIDPDLLTDAAVCGDLDQTGRIDLDDYDALRESLAGVTALPPGALERCSVSGEASSCGILDAVHLARALLSDEGPGLFGPGLRQSCPAAFDFGQGLVGYWPFEPEGGAIANATPSGEILDAIPSVTPRLAPGVVGSALEFLSAGEQLRVDHPAGVEALRAYSQLSVQVWIHPTAQSSSNDVILTKEGEYALARFPDGSIRYSIAPDWVWVDSGLVAATNVWTHVVWVFDALARRAAAPAPELPLPYRLFEGEVRVYANGVEAAQPWASGGVGDANPALQELRIAGHQASPTQRFAGFLDEVAIWQRPLSRDEVAHLYGGGAGLALDATRFDPATLGPRLWLDAADAATLDTSPAGEVLAWADKSGNGLHVAPVTTTPRRVEASLAALPTVQFDGAADVLCAAGALSLPGAATIVSVARNDVRRDYNGVFSLRASTSVNADLELYWQAGSSGSGNLVYLVNRGLAGTGNVIANNAGPAPATDFYLASVTTATGSPTTLRVDTGASSGANGLLPANGSRPCVGLGFGATTIGNTLDGNIAELLVFDRVLTAAERVELETHLVRKWGL